MSITEAPDGDDFFTPPDPLPGADHGDLIRSRAVGAPVALSGTTRNELILYRSEAVDGTPIAVSGIVALPESDPPPGGYPVVSWAHGTLGLASAGSPSRDDDEIAARLPEHHAINQAPHVLLNAFLAAGWAVVMSDYEGLGVLGTHPYLLGESEARGVLDIVRAARQLHPELSDRLAITGHSQGGQGALFAAHHAPAWTPEADLRAVSVLAPASYLRDSLLDGARYDGEFPGFAFTPLMLTGAVVGSAAGATACGAPIDPAKVLTDRAMELFQRSGDKTRVELAMPEMWGGINGCDQFRDDIVESPNPDQAEFLRQIDEFVPALSIGAPIRIAHAQTDTRVSILGSNKLVGELGVLGNTVTYQIYAEVADAGDLGAHFGIFETDTTATTAWLSTFMT
jgi:hypothetical protein